LLENKNTSLKQKPETAVLVGIITNPKQKEKVQEYLDELAFLVETAGGKPLERFTQPLDYPNSKTYVGSGKLDEIRQYVKAAEIDMVVFDDELPVISDIFATPPSVSQGSFCYLILLDLLESFLTDW